MLCSISGPNCLNGGIESALLSRDGEHDALLDVRSDRSERRNPGHRISVEIERQPAIERGLADQQHAAGIAVAGSQFAKPHQRIGIAVLAHVAEYRDRDLALVQREQQLDRADNLKPFDRASACGRRGV